MAKTVYDLLKIANHFDGLPTVNAEVDKILKKHGHFSGKTAGCTNTLMVMFYQLGSVDIIGGYANNNKPFVAQAKKAGIWHSGKDGILPGDIVVFGRNGESNHTELAIGDNLDISGNYKGGCYRRTRSSHSSDILGYARPKYDKMGGMDDLQTVIAAADVLIGVYGTLDTRKRLLSVFGSDNAQKIQDAVTEAIKSNTEDKIIAVACIADHYGKDPGRSKKLGRWADKVQKRINAIYSMRGKSIEQAARDVINDNYGKGKVRELLLTFCGYTPGEVQDRVNLILKPVEPAKETPTRFRVHMIPFFKKDESAYGACTAIYQYNPDGTIAKCILIDTGMAKTADVVIAELKAQGVHQIDVIIVSHGHGDHYGGVAKVVKAIPTKWIYLPETTELDKYQKTYGNKLRRQAIRVANHRWYKRGDSAVIGEIKFQCLYSCKASDLKEHDAHHYVNNMSPFCHFTLGSFVWHTAGDAQNPANNLFVSAMKKAGISTKCHGLEFHWHTDGNATNDNLMGATNPKICGSNYHHSGWHSGRKIAKKRAEAVGAHCYATADDGNVWIDVTGRKVVVSTSKSGKCDTYTI